jgi:hypothetical protein
MCNSLRSVTAEATEGSSRGKLHLNARSLRSTMRPGSGAGPDRQPALPTVAHAAVMLDNHGPTASETPHTGCRFDFIRALWQQPAHDPL